MLDGTACQRHSSTMRKSACCRGSGIWQYSYMAAGQSPLARARLYIGSACVAQRCCSCIQGGPKKVSHYRESSLNRIENRQPG